MTIISVQNAGGNQQGQESQMRHKSKLGHFAERKVRTKQNPQCKRIHGILPAWLGKELEEKEIRICVERIKAGRALPDCTGVSTGVTLVNSWSKLLVSVALLMVGMNGGGTRLW